MILIVLSKARRFLTRQSSGMESQPHQNITQLVWSQLTPDTPEFFLINIFKCLVNMMHSFQPLRTPCLFLLLNEILMEISILCRGTDCSRLWDFSYLLARTRWLFSIKQGLIIVWKVLRAVHGSHVTLQNLFSRVIGKQMSFYDAEWVLFLCCDSW